MAKYRKQPVVIEATQWFKNGNHPKDYSDDTDGFANGTLVTFSGNYRRDMGWEGSVVRYFRRPDVSAAHKCSHCFDQMHNHGWIDTLEGGHIVCPGDWIITGVQGEVYPCKPSIFDSTYEIYEEGDKNGD